MTTWRTRIAPSPTGCLHLGHAVHILCVQGIASNLGASISLRLEDHDRGRCRPEFEASIIEDLAWLGVETPTTLWRQSERHSVYQMHLEDLMRRGVIYACECSRKNVQEETGQTSGELRYPGTCRNKRIPLDQPNTCVRVQMREGSFSFKDLFLGELTQVPAEQCGDIVIRDRQGQWTYQFAVVVDDLDQQINLIIRGQDLLSSSGRQLALREMIQPGSPIPTFAHHPLIRDDTGEKLSKRIFSRSLASFRESGLSADQVRGMAAKLAGLTESNQGITLRDVPNLFRHIINP